MTQLKVCGIHADDDLSFATHPVVTHIGFVFVSESRRFIRPQDATVQANKLRGHCQTVGVFANAPRHEVETIAASIGLDVVQLHGSESPAYCRQLQERGFQVWKTLCMPATATQLADVHDGLQQYQAGVNGLLLDSAPPSGSGRVSGGHGNAWDWTLAEIAFQFPFAKLRPQLWCAGGLHPGNVHELLQSCRPDGIDVSSGVESDGRKSMQKIYQMIEAVSGVDRSFTVPG